MPQRRLQTRRLSNGGEAEGCGTGRGEVINSKTLTDDQIRKSDACTQCKANASWNLAGGYRVLAAACLRYCAGGHCMLNEHNARAASKDGSNG